MTLLSRKEMTAYVDCFSGISGDMFLGALISAGLPPALLSEALKQIDLADYQIVCRETSKHSTIQATELQVKLSGHPPHRHWRTIRALIASSRLSEPVKSRALSIFQVLATAEANVHGCPIDDVHFHEVGAVDSIIDIVGAAIGLDYFQVSALTCAPLPMSTGRVQTAHGSLPLPAPAVCEILKTTPVYGVDINMELVTPTGAAIVKACASEFGPLPTMTIRQIGYGAGSKLRPDGQPNLLRLIIGESRLETENQQVTVIETNLDDWSPETFPFLSEQLFNSGALDVTLIPIQMKKGRPGFTIQVIAPPSQAFPLQQILLGETSAIGLRFRQEERRTLPRHLGTVMTPVGRVKVKLIESPTGPRITPEYEDCRRIALEKGISITTLYQLVAIQPADNFNAKN
ncbi:MAG: nickel pincer cofactor biosynthesis protein LarC [Desulfobulbaceae bacterium]|nr:nickel pincer cofactor biosynthesis protein LarC [Desulfobulbaceae bacterium]